MTEKKPSVAKAAKHKGKNRLLLLVLLLVVLSPLALFGAIVAPGPLEQNKTVVIPHGTSIQEIGNLLARNDVAYSALLFRLAAKIVTYDDLKSGEYLFTPHQSLTDIALMMH